MPEDMTLGEYMKRLTLRMQQEKLILLFKDEKPWHMLFYRLKSATPAASAPFLSALRFDWDGPYPRCKQLSEFIQALHWTGSVTAGNPSYEQITLQEDVHNLWAKAAPDVSAEWRDVVDQGIALAMEEFPAHTRTHA